MLQLDPRITSAQGLFYLATPFTHKEYAIRQYRHSKGLEVYGKLMAQGVHAYYAIGATWEISNKHSLPIEFEFWLQRNRYFLDASCGILVAKIDGWRESRGVAQEINYAKNTGKPVFYLNAKGDSCSAL